MAWSLQFLDRLAGEAIIVKELSPWPVEGWLRYRQLPLIVRVARPTTLPLPERPRLWLYWKCNYGQYWYGSPLTPLGLLAAVGVAFPLLLVNYLGGIGRDLRGIVARMRVVGGGVPLAPAPRTLDALDRDDGPFQRALTAFYEEQPNPPQDSDPDTIARLVEFAHAGNRADFDWLAQSAGVQAGELDALWEGTCQRVRHGDSSRGRGEPGLFELNTLARLRLEPGQPRGDRITINRVRPLALPEFESSHEDTFFVRFRAAMGAELEGARWAGRPLHEVAVVTLDTIDTRWAVEVRDGTRRMITLFARAFRERGAGTLDLAQFIQTAIQRALRIPPGQWSFDELHATRDPRRYDCGWAARMARGEDWHPVCRTWHRPENCPAGQNPQHSMKG